MKISGKNKIIIIASSFLSVIVIGSITCSAVHLSKLPKVNQVYGQWDKDEINKIFITISGSNLPLEAGKYKFYKSDGKTEIGDWVVDDSSTSKKVTLFKYDSNIKNETIKLAIYKMKGNLVIKI